jgi:hypothetical protein
MNVKLKRRADRLHTEPVLSIDTATSTYSTTAAYGLVAVKETDGTYTGFFVGSNGTNTVIMMTKSSDCIKWGAPVLVPNTSYAVSTAYMPCISVLKDTEGYKLWYTVNNVLYYMTSADGIAWGKPSKEFTFTGTNTAISVVKNGSKYRMFYTNSEGTTSLFYMTSDDGITWANKTTYFTLTTTGYTMSCPFVFKDSKNVWHILYTMTNTSTSVEYLATRYTDDLDGIMIPDDAKFVMPGYHQYDTGNKTKFPYAVETSDGKFVIGYSSISSAATSNWRVLSVECDVWPDYPDTYANSFVLDNGNEVYIKKAKPVLKENFGCSVVKESDTSYKMWSAERDYTGTVTNNVSIFYRTSTDGETWDDRTLAIKYNSLNYCSLMAMHPCVIKESDTSYKMWFDGSNGTNTRILYSTSTDGTTWTTPVLAVNIGATNCGTHVSYPCVIKESDTSYKMWLSGSNGTNWRIFYCTSVDGTTWSTPVLAMDIGTSIYNIVSSVSAQVIKKSDVSYEMIFVGGQDTRLRYILRSTSTDGVTWTSPSLLAGKDELGKMYSPTYSIYDYINDSGKYKLYIGCINDCRYLLTSAYYNSAAGTIDINETVGVNEKSTFADFEASNGYAVMTVLSVEKPKMFVAGERIQFNCVGKSIKINTNNATKIKIECYGGTGGSAGSYSGGNGGYAYGEFTPNKPLDVFVNVGGRGGRTDVDSINVGYNGGGIISTPLYDYAYTGGGASDVRTKENDTSYRIIVAAGGGSADGNDGTGGNGGGWTGTSGIFTDSTDCYASGGSQTSNGADDHSIIPQYGPVMKTINPGCGTSYHMQTGMLPDCYGAGGGGYYGGGSSGGCGGGGGSSYVAGNVNCPGLHPDGIALTNSGTTAGANTQKDGRIIMTILETTESVRYSVGDKVRFDYTGKPQTFIQGNATDVKIECYGASGGYNTNESKGGYAYGTLSLKKVDTLSIVVGSMGTAGTKGVAGTGGYNGGGNGGKPFSVTYNGGSGGGGATDVRTIIADDIFDNTSLLSRLVVAGGGGGDSSTSMPGDGGGWSGIAATTLSENGSSLPGSQKIGNSLGKGGNGDDATVEATNSSEGNGGGGGGYYGAYGGYKLNNGEGNNTSGAGGSSYVSGDSNCPVKASSGITLTSTGTTASSNTGNGYCIVTVTAVTDERKYVSGEKFTFSNINDVQTFTTKNARRIRIECYGPRGAKGDSNCGEPGKGGYTSGDMILNSPETLYLYCGGIGGYNTGNACGYNGGGQVKTNNDTKVYYGSGATDVRTAKDDLTRRIIVAGGGGSASVGKNTVTSKAYGIDGIDGGNWEIDQYIPGFVPETTFGTPFDVMKTTDSTYQSTQVSYPSIIKNASGVYKMWYSGFSGSTGRILYSESTDGKNWSAPIIALNVNCVSYASTYISNPSVIEEDGMYRMWSVGYNGTNFRILHSKSEDGVTWSIPTLVLNSGVISAATTGCHAPFVIKDNGVYKMWFEAINGNTNVVAYTTSLDGITWETPKVIISATPSAKCNVIKESDSMYKMWVQSGSPYRLCYSTSTDGIGWSALTVIPSLAETCMEPLVMYDNGVYKVWYITSANLRYTETVPTKTTQTVPAVLPLYATSGQANYGTGTTTAQPGIGTTMTFNGLAAVSYLTNYSTLFAPGAGGWYGSLSSAIVGQGGSSYIAGDANCPTKHPDGVVLFNTTNVPGVNDGEGKIVITVLETENDFKYEVGDKVWFRYRGAPEEFESKNISKMHIECWGANGGSTGVYGGGGTGGYTYGDIVRTSADKNLLAVVGSAGETCTTAVSGTLVKGGYNGGGVGSDANGDYASGGGGATDIRTDSTDLYSRMIVAGGGGGQHQTRSGNYSVTPTVSKNGMNGGGWISKTNDCVMSDGSNNFHVIIPGAGQSVCTTTANYNIPGTFGAGASITLPNEGGGGGGGYYGGNTTGMYCGAGGGSSYASGDQECPALPSNGIILTNTGTVAGYNDFASGNGVAWFTVLETDDGNSSITENLVMTGTGPASWSHDNTNLGIYDLTGNLYGLCTGFRVNGSTLEPQVIPNNDAAMPNIDFADDNVWKSIDASGNYVQIGSGVKYTSGMAGVVDVLFSAVAVATTTYIHKALGIIPVDTTQAYESAKHTFKNVNSATMMNVCFRGGCVGDTAQMNSIFSAYFRKLNTDEVNTNIGYRVCYYEP